MRTKMVLVLTVMATIALAETVDQNDWTGTSGIAGPVVNWSSNYYSSQYLDTSGSNLQIVKHFQILPPESPVNHGFNGAISVRTADIDGDGYIDIVGAGLTQGDIRWWSNVDGSGTQLKENIVTTGLPRANGVYPADLDNDGDIDIVGTASKPTSLVHWWENTDGSGTTWVEHTVENGVSGAVSPFVIDINGDGHLDIVVCAIYDNDVMWYENVGGTGTSWTRHDIASSFTWARSVHANDIDNDGDMDVIAVSIKKDQIIWWENTNGSGKAWTSHIIDPFIDMGYGVYSADIDGDGDGDVMGCGLWANAFFWYENLNGSGTQWEKHLLHDASGLAASVYATDMDNDGDIDMLGGSSGHDNLVLWENLDGQAKDLRECMIDNHFDGMSIFADDINGDGIKDVLCASYEENDISWWDCWGYGDGNLVSSILDMDPSSVSWESFVSTAKLPSNTSVAFQFKSSTDHANMGSWSDTVYASNGDITALANPSEYFQYKVILLSSNPSETPSLEDVSFTYSIASSIEDTSSPALGIAPAMNPSNGNLVINISVTDAGPAGIQLYDVTGRIVSEIEKSLPAGLSSVTWDNLTEGIYFCVLTSGDNTVTQKVVLVRD